MNFFFHLCEKFCNSASESPTLDFAALAREIVNSLEGKETDGVKPLISINNTETLSTQPGQAECKWDYECTSSTQNQVTIPI